MDSDPQNSYLLGLVDPNPYCLSKIKKKIEKDTTILLNFLMIYYLLFGNIFFPIATKTFR